MYEPPAGYLDLESDAATLPVVGQLEDLEIPGVGTVRARRPAPRSAAALAWATNHKLDEATRQAHLVAFVYGLVDEDDLDTLLVELITAETIPVEAMGQLARALSTWGTARPYTAVGTLCAITGHHWRTVRSRLSENGISAPLVEFASLHALLDVTERLVLESLSHSGEGKNAVADGKRKADDFLDHLYRPDLSEAKGINGKAYRPAPAGFDEDAMESAFDAFMGSAAAD